jgi:hypothetical protein
MNVWRNYINKPKLSTYITNTTEVGYSHYGPTFSASGVLSALSAVVLVHNICAEVTLKNNGVSHFMDWFAFRPANYAMGNFSGMDLTMASKFTVAPDHPHEQNTLFIDANRFSEMKPILTAIKDAWEESMATATKVGETVKTDSLFAEFKELKMVADATERLKTMNYWEAGEYNVRVRVTTESPKQFFDMKGSFVLKDEDVEILEGNIPAIIANICHQPQVTYLCTTPTLIIRS